MCGSVNKTSQLSCMGLTFDSTLITGSTIETIAIEQWTFTVIFLDNCEIQGYR